MAKEFVRSGTGNLLAVRALRAAGVPDANACIVGDLREKLAEYQ